MNWYSKKRREEKVEVKSRRVSPGLIRQMSVIEQVNFFSEYWVFTPRLVTSPRHVIKIVGHVANRKIPLVWANYNFCFYKNES